jgi:dTDP-4-amino-4,6-dideoxygalactose transaminase
MLRDHGQVTKYYHEIAGYNGRLDAIQAGLLRVKLKMLPVWNEQRREAASRYRELFAAAGREDLAPYEPDTSRAVYHLYVVRVPDRDRVIRSLTAAHIGTGIHYPVPIHLQNAYRDLGHQAGDFPVAEQAAREVLSLPMFPQLRVEQQERVVEALGVMERAKAAVGARG